jgi:hypothetical protein
LVFLVFVEPIGGDETDDVVVGLFADLAAQGDEVGVVHA